MIEACEYLTGTPVGEKVAVIGGGLTGCEIAYELALQGRQPVIVEMKTISSPRPEYAWPTALI